MRHLFRRNYNGKYQLSKRINRIAAKNKHIGIHAQHQRTRSIGRSTKHARACMRKCRRFLVRSYSVLVENYAKVTKSCVFGNAAGFFAIILMIYYFELTHNFLGFLWRSAFQLNPNATPIRSTWSKYWTTKIHHLHRSPIRNNWCIVWLFFGGFVTAVPSCVIYGVPISRREREKEKWMCVSGSCLSWLTIDFISNMSTHSYFIFHTCGLLILYWKVCSRETAKKSRIFGNWTESVPVTHA